MKWICFSDSAKGILCTAKTQIMPELTPEDIILLQDDLSLGDISDLYNRDARKFSVCPWYDFPELADENLDEQLEEYYTSVLPSLDEVKEAVIFYGDNAQEIIGLYYAASRLLQKAAKVYAVKIDEIPGDEIKELNNDGPISILFSTKKGKPIRLPHFLSPLLIRHMKRKEKQKRKGKMVSFRSVGQTDAGAISYFYGKKKELSESDKQKFAQEWERLKRENTDLRILQSGAIRSVSETYFDKEILETIDEEGGKETAVAHIIGKMLTKYEANPYFFMKRIEALGEMGEVFLGEKPKDYAWGAGVKRNKG